MTTPPADTRDYMTDTEIIRHMRELGIPEKVARKRIRLLDKTPSAGFPPKNEFWGNRRSWPAVKAYLEASFRSRIADGAARSAAESRDRTRLPRRHHAEPRGGHLNDD